MWIRGRRGSSHRHAVDVIYSTIGRFQQLLALHGESKVLAGSAGPSSLEAPTASISTLLAKPGCAPENFVLVDGLLMAAILTHRLGTE